MGQLFSSTASPQNQKVARDRPPQVSPSAHQINPYLFIGNYASAASTDFLTSHQISFVLNLTAFDHDRQAGIEYLWLSASDNEDYDLSQLFKAGHEFIERARHNHSTALVHCEMGVSRSATMAMAHLMLCEDGGLEESLSNEKTQHSESSGDHYGGDCLSDSSKRRTLRQVWDLVRKHRSACCPNEGFFEQLQCLEKEMYGRNSMTTMEYESVARTAQAKVQMAMFDALSDSCN